VLRSIFVTKKRIYSPIRVQNYTIINVSYTNPVKSRFNSNFFLFLRTEKYRNQTDHRNCL